MPTATSSTAITRTRTDGGGPDGPGEPGWVVVPAEVARMADRLACGTLSLSAPVLDGVIQIGSGQPLPTTVIEVHVRPGLVRVRRTDGHALQAQILHRADGEIISRTAVFTTAVHEVSLCSFRPPEGPTQWRVPASQLGAAPGPLLQLITTIVSFGIAKQNRAAASRPRQRAA